MAGTLVCDVWLAVKTEEEIEPLLDKIREHMQAGLRGQVGTAEYDWETIKTFRFTSVYERT